MKDVTLHRAQIIVLETLRHRSSARYAQLQKQTDMESDSFKFHLRSLVQSGYLIKTDGGAYQLTAAGKDFANNLDTKKRVARKQPKVSVLLVATCEGPYGELQYLIQTRKRQPYWGYSGFLSGPLVWGEPTETVAECEFMKQTGLVGRASVVSFLRQRDYEHGGILLEDKLFVVTKIELVEQAVDFDWDHGSNHWLTLPEIERTEHLFPTTMSVIKALSEGDFYISLDASFPDAEY